MSAYFDLEKVGVPLDLQFLGLDDWYNLGNCKFLNTTNTEDAHGGDTGYPTRYKNFHYSVNNVICETFFSEKTKDNCEKMSDSNLKSIFCKKSNNSKIFYGKPNKNPTKKD